MRGREERSKEVRRGEQEERRTGREERRKVY